jgi:pyrimidine-nucleoside phosphorylase
MRAVDLIVKKRSGAAHSPEEISFLVNGYVSGDIPDYQIAAWLMAVFFSGMDEKEAGRLTQAMIDSGTTIDLSSLSGPLVDKHSTGGVGDKVSLILAPVAAACGVQVPMMSGRALGHTGGTLDKLESMPGYTTALSTDRFAQIITEAGFAMTGQSQDIVPADRLLYALRDVTGTVESVPLITASILSKKFAEGAESLVFDVKCGSGAFMKTREDARTLAKSLINAGESLGRRIAAVVTDMSEPLGHKVGNFMEVEESVYCLMGSSAPSGFTVPDDLMTVTLRLTAWMLVLGGVADDVDDGLQRCRDAIDSGRAYERFMKNVELQGADPDQVQADLGTRRAPAHMEIAAPRAGWITEIDAYKIGMAGVHLGVGRNKADESVDPLAGIDLPVKCGAEIARGDTLCVLYAANEDRLQAARSPAEAAFSVSGEAPQSAGASSEGERMILEEHVGSGE